MINERDNLTPEPKLAVLPRKSDVFAERQETQLVLVMLVLSFLVSVATVYGIIMGISWAMS